MSWKYKEKLRIKGKLVVGFFFASLVLNYRLSEHVHAHYLDGKSYDIMTLSYMKKNTDNIWIESNEKIWIYMKFARSNELYTCYFV